MCIYDVLTAKYIPSSDSMVIVLDGSSEHDASHWTNLKCYQEKFGTQGGMIKVDNWNYK